MAHVLSYDDTASKDRSRMWRDAERVETIRALLQNFDRADWPDCPFTLHDEQILRALATRTYRESRRYGEHATAQAWAQHEAGKAAADYCQSHEVIDLDELARIVVRAYQHSLEG